MKKFNIINFKFASVAVADNFDEKYNIKSVWSRLYELLYI